MCQNIIIKDTHTNIFVAIFTESINCRQWLQTQVNQPKRIEGRLNVTWFISLQVRIL